MSRIYIGEFCLMSFLNHMTIFMRQFEDICHHSMHSYVNGVSKYVYNGSNVLFLGVLSNRIVTTPFSGEDYARIYDNLH